MCASRARRRANRNVRPTLITAFPTRVPLKSQLVVGVGERSPFGLACHARKRKRRTILRGNDSGGFGMTNFVIQHFWMRLP